MYHCPFFRMGVWVIAETTQIVTGAAGSMISKVDRAMARGPLLLPMAPTTGLRVRRRVAGPSAALPL